MSTLSSVPEELKRELAKKIRGLKFEYYDLLHKHGYADFKLDVEEESEGYAEDEKWLEGIYIVAFESIIDQQIKSVLDGLGNNIKHNIKITTVQGIDPLEDGQYIKVKNMLDAIQKIRSRYE